MSFYDFEDFFSDSEMETNRDTYKSVMDDVEDNIKDAKEKISSIKESISSEISVWKGSAGQSYGTICDCYFDRLGIYQEAVNAIIGYFEECIGKYEEALSTVSDKYNYYKEQAELEDEQEQVISE